MNKPGQPELRLPPLDAKSPDFRAGLLSAGNRGLSETDVAFDAGIRLVSARFRAALPLR